MTEKHAYFVVSVSLEAGLSVRLSVWFRHNFFLKKAKILTVNDGFIQYSVTWIHIQVYNILQSWNLTYLKIQTLILELYWGDLLKSHWYIQGHDLTSTILTLMVDLEGDECGAGFRHNDTIIQSSEELRLNRKFTLLCECSGLDHLFGNLSYVSAKTWKYLLYLSSLSFRRAVTEKEVASTKYQVKSLNADVKATLRFFL